MQTTRTGHNPKSIAVDPKLLKGMELCKQLGIDLGSSLQPIKRRKN